MARPLNEIADDILAIEQTVKEVLHKLMQAMQFATGQNPDPNEPVSPTAKQTFGLSDGRQIELADIAAELRDHHLHAGDFGER